MKFNISNQFVTSSDCDVGDGEGVVVLSARHVGGTRDSGIVFGATYVLGISVVCGMRGVGGVCEMFMCFARAAKG